MPNSVNRKQDRVFRKINGRIATKRPSFIDAERNFALRVRHAHPSAIAFFFRIGVYTPAPQSFGVTCAGASGAGCREPDAGYREPDANCWEPDANRRELDAGYWEPDAGYREPDANRREPDAGYRELDANCWEPDADRRAPGAGECGISYSNK
jgi:hypothetical protein